MIDNSFRNKFLKKPDKKLLEFLPEMIDIIELATLLISNKISNKMSIKWSKYQLGVVDVHFISNEKVKGPFFDRLKILLEHRYPVYIIWKIEKGHNKFEIYIKEYV